MPSISAETPLPRLAPHLISRPKIESWLKRHADVPVRLFAAPSGSGKLTSIVTYMQARGGGAYLRLQRAEPPRAMRQRLARALNLAKAPASFDELLVALRRRAPVEIAFFDVVMAAEETLEEIDRLVDEAPAGVNLIVGTRSRAIVDVSRMLASGCAVLCDAEMLAFDAYETTRLAEALGVASTPSDIAYLLHESEGWAAVTTGVLRHAATTGRPLSGAFEDWVRRQGRLFSEFIARELEFATERERTAFHRLIAGAQSALPELETTGLFVRYDESGYRPYRVVARLCGAEPRLAADESVPALPMTVKMFGRFEAEIGGRPIPWVRRRDQDLFKYLLLKGNSSASRGELIETFWPQADPHLAGQSLRTACANVRKAIGTLVGSEGAERYISTNGAICLNLAHIVVDVRRFKAHITDGDEEYERGHHDEAIAHYRAADALYRGPLLQEDASAPWFAPRVAMYQELYVHSLERQGECWIAKGEPILARQCAYRVLALKPDAVEGRRLVRLALSSPGPSEDADQKRRAIGLQQLPERAEIALEH
ncbi:hypothetical protein EPN44_06595 [bacterium]|nr:MAG: hypothetical protein EPN44_06595 [bacterium]